MAGSKRGRQLDGRTPIFLSVAYVAEQLGVSQTMVRRMMDAEQLPWVTVGRRRKIPAQCFDGWADQQVDAALARQMQRRKALAYARISCN